MKRSLVVCVVVVTTGCGFIPGEGFFSGPDSDGVTADELPTASRFSCDDLDSDPLLCVDFNDGAAPGFSWEGGDWQVVDGRLVGYGPDAPSGACSDSLMTHAVVTQATAQDLVVSLEMTAMERVDKVLLLRSVDGANRLQLNFRALTRDGNYGDLMIQEIRDCAFTLHTAEGELPIGHEMGEKIDVEVRLIGTHLRVKVDGHEVVSRDFPIAVRSGAVGLGVIDHATSVFDDLVVTAP